MIKKFFLLSAVFIIVSLGAYFLLDIKTPDPPYLATEKFLPISLPTVKATPTSLPPLSEIVKIKKEIDIYFSGVPFTAQAALANWSDPRQQDACEEASLLMALSWARGTNLFGSLQSAENEIIKFAEWQIERYSHSVDTSAEDTARIAREYFNYEKIRTEENITSDDIINELKAGNLVIVPVNDRRLANPHFTQPGPVTHMLVVRGYSYLTNEFITNDPGTRFGENYKYSRENLEFALQDYPTGASHGRQIKGDTAMIIVSK